MQLTKRAPDVWDSARFTSIFLASSFFSHLTQIYARWITPKEVIGLADYIYLQAFCHTRNAERTFRLDRIIEVAVEVEKE